MKPEHLSGHPHGSRSLGAGALGAGALGTSAIGTAAVGALALGAIALGAVAIGRLTVRRARIRNLVIDELVIRRLRVLDPEWPALPADEPALIEPPGGPEEPEAGGRSARADFDASQQPTTGRTPPRPPTLLQQRSLRTRSRPLGWSWAALPSHTVPQ